jgi:tartrate dehydrogenase/decarboxylase/D-malate dehydrogenase
MMLEHLGEHSAAQSLHRAIETTLLNPAGRTADIGGVGHTADVISWLVDAVASGTVS